MLELDFIEIDEEKIKKIKDKNINRIYENEEMRIFINENKIPVEFVYAYLSDFIKILDDKEKCKICQGVNKCKTKGYYFDLEVDIKRHFTNIKFLQCKLLQNRNKIKNKFIICDTDYSFFDYDLKDSLNYFKDDRKLAVAKMAKIIKEELNTGIYIYGQKGIGKSFILSVFSKLIVSKRDGHFVYINAKNAIPSMIEASFKDKDAFLDDMDLFKTVDYLFIDNFGEEEKNDFSKESIIFEILSYRKDNNLPTYFASIYSLNDLFTAYRTPKSGNYRTKELIDIISSTCSVINIPTSSKVATNIF